MRSRYTAFVLEDLDYIVQTHDPDTLDEEIRDSAAQWSRESDWRGLEILSTEEGGAEDSNGSVEFVAHYAVGGKAYAHHEKSRFRRIDERWFYVEGEMVAHQPQVRADRKVGRNEPCPCGSGKKYKKCCGSAASGA